MTDGRDSRERWALVLGASSGFGGATAKALGRDGYAIVGVHLDLRASRADAEAVRDEIAAMGVPVVFHNVNAADAERRAAVIDDIRSRFEARRAEGADPYIAVFLHSLAFGATLSYITTEPEKKELSQKQLEMTVDVMGHSMVYWVHDLFHAGLFADGSRLFAMTSRGCRAQRPDLRCGLGGQGRPPIALPAAGHGAHPAMASRSTASAPA